MIWCDQCVRIINVHVLLNFQNFQNFQLLEGRNYARLSEFSGFSKCDNDVITCRGVRNFEWKPKLVGGCQKLSLYAKNHIWKLSSFFNQLGTYKQIYTFIYTLTGQKYLNNNNLYSYIQASRGKRTSVDASTWMLT